MNNLLVSIVIPTYSRPDNLCRAIDSVLAQTYSPIEIVVVDDNGVGTDFQLETEKILTPYLLKGQIVYLKHETNKNGSAARNTGSRASHGEYIGYLDDDDVFFPEKIQMQVERLVESRKSNPKVAGVYCNIEMRGYKKDEFKLISHLEGNLSEALLMSEIRFNSSTILMTRNAYESINGWDERFLRHQDWEFCLRFFRKYEMVLASPETCLVAKYCTPNFNTTNPDKVAHNLEFFIEQMKTDIEQMDRAKDILSYKYFGLSRCFFLNMKYKKGFEYLNLANKYRSRSSSDYISILKSIIKSFVR